MRFFFKIASQARPQRHGRGTGIAADTARHPRRMHLARGHGVNRAMNASTRCVAVDWHREPHWVRSEKKMNRGKTKTQHEKQSGPSAYLRGPRAFHQARLEHLLPAMQTLHVGSPRQTLRDLLPALPLVLHDRVAQNFVLTEVERGGEAWDNIR